jgi:hypothetical protein
VGDDDVVAIHDRDLVFEGRARLRRLLAERAGGPFVTVQEVGERMERASR